MIKIISLGLVIVCLADESAFPYPEDRNATISELVCNTYIYKFEVPSRRVNKGKDAEIGQFPFMGAVGWLIRGTTDAFEFKCGSTLISEKFLLTVGHCTQLSTIQARRLTSPEPRVVMLGVENIVDKGTEERQPKIVEILNIIQHPEYRSPKRYHDIALLELQEEIEFTEFIKPACVWPYKDVDLAGQTATISGWGKTGPALYSETAAHLQYAEVDIFDNSKCDKLLERGRNHNWHGVTDGQICAGILEGGVDTCQNMPTSEHRHHHSPHPSAPRQPAFSLIEYLDHQPQRTAVWSNPHRLQRALSLHRPVSKQSMKHLSWSAHVATTIGHQAEYASNAWNGTTANRD